MTNSSEADDAVERMWHSALTERHDGRFSSWPSSHRCTICRTPFSGISGRLARLAGFHASHMNPHICNYCEDMLPPGGAEVDVAVIFADVRGSTQIAETMPVREYTKLMNRFYSVASAALIKRRANIDKLIGDEVMGFLIPSSNPGTYRREAVAAAVDILESVGYKQGSKPWLPVAIGVHSGLAFAGKVGTDGVYSFTALGDSINTAARLRSEAKAGEILLGESIYRDVEDQYPDLDSREIMVKGKSQMVRAYSLRTVGIPATAGMPGD